MLCSRLKFPTIFYVLLELILCTKRVQYVAHCFLSHPRTPDHTYAFPLEKKMPHFIAFTWPIAILYFIVFCVCVCFLTFPSTLCGLYIRYDILLICLYIWTMKITTGMPAISWSIYIRYVVDPHDIVAILPRPAATQKAPKKSHSVGQVSSGQVESLCIFISLYCRATTKWPSCICVDCVWQHTLELSICLVYHPSVCPKAV